ncbi:MAG: transcriptional regulator [Alphaproteobacteria bacterium]|nr:transcriptional regulator [Alphaproteobacteria bacterium]
MSQENQDTQGLSDAALVEMTAQLVASYVRQNSLSAEQLPELIRSVHGSLKAADSQPEAAPEKTQKPAVPVKKSVTPDYLICLEDGKKLKMLKRHLRAKYDMSPEDYRAKWGLPPDYPMVAPNYAAQRSNFAREIGLGRAGRAAGGPEAEAGASHEGDTA